MIEQFNRIVQKFGGNRVRLMLAHQHQAVFEIVGWGVFAIMPNGAIVERTGLNVFVPTANSMWLGSVSLGRKRNDAGEPLVG